MKMYDEIPKIKCEYFEVALIVHNKTVLHSNLPLINIIIVLFSVAVQF